MKINPICNGIAVLFLVIFCFDNGLYGQQSIDSAYYHYHKILKPTHKEDLLNAFRFFESRKSEAQSQEDTTALIYNLQLLSIIHYDLGLLNESEQTTVEILELLDARSGTNDAKEDYWRVYNQLGRVYRNLKFNEQSIDYYKKALSMATSTEDSVVLMNNIANSYRDLNDSISASAFYKLSYTKSLNPFLPVAYARTLSNMYFEEALSGNAAAKDSLLKARQLRESYNDFKGLFSSYRQLALVAAKNNDLQKANAYAEEALKLAQSINSAMYLREALSLFMEISDNPSVQNYKRVSDSLESIRLYQENTYASMKYNIDREREKTLASQIQQEREKGQKHLYQALGAFLLLSGGFVFYVIQQRHKKAKAREVYLTETRISGKVHDEVANDVYRVMTKLQLPASDTSEILDDLEAIYGKTRDISKEYSSILLNDDFEESLNDLLLSYTNEHCNVVTKNSKSVNWEALNENRKRVIYRVLQELMTNMRKHSKATVAVISFSESGKKISVEYKDNGVGGSLQKNNGLQNAENRILAIKGSITFETAPQKGFKVGFTV
jgi:signal transduction histidine kinase